MAMDPPLLSTAAKRQHGGGLSGHHARQGGESNGTADERLEIDMAHWVFHVVGMDDTGAWCSGSASLGANGSL